MVAQRQRQFHALDEIAVIRRNGGQEHFGRRLFARDVGRDRSFDRDRVQRLASPFEDRLIEASQPVDAVAAALDPDLVDDDRVVEPDLPFRTRAHRGDLRPPVEVPSSSRMVWDATLLDTLLPLRPCAWTRNYDEHYGRARFYRSLTHIGPGPGTGLPGQRWELRGPTPLKPLRFRQGSDKEMRGCGVSLGRITLELEIFPSWPFLPMPFRALSPPRPSRLRRKRAS